MVVARSAGVPDDICRVRPIWPARTVTSSEERVRGAQAVGMRDDDVEAAGDVAGERRPCPRRRRGPRCPVARRGRRRGGRRRTGSRAPRTDGPPAPRRVATKSVRLAGSESAESARAGAGTRVSRTAAHDSETSARRHHGKAACNGFSRTRDGPGKPKRKCWRTYRPGATRNRPGARFVDEIFGAQPRSGSARRARSCRIAFVWIWHTRLSVTPSTDPISASVRPS